MCDSEANVGSAAFVSWPDCHVGGSMVRPASGPAACMDDRQSVDRSSCVEYVTSGSLVTCNFSAGGRDGGCAGRGAEILCREDEVGEPVIVGRPAVLRLQFSGFSVIVPSTKMTRKLLAPDSLTHVAPTRM